MGYLRQNVGYNAFCGSRMTYYGVLRFVMACYGMLWHAMVTIVPMCVNQFCRFSTKNSGEIEPEIKIEIKKSNQELNRASELNRRIEPRN
jgi:uncharacterized membrane protein YedE/YeeE